MTKILPTLEQLEALKDKGMSWAEVSYALGYKSRNGAQQRYHTLTGSDISHARKASRDSYHYLKTRDPHKVTWRELHDKFGVTREHAMAILTHTRVQWRMADLRNKDTQPPPPPWRDNGLGESIAYQRALERVERYVAAGDDRSAAINQVAQETGIRVL
jgi:hypothetical protein